MWENVGIMTQPISLPDIIVRSLVDLFIDHDRPTAMYATASPDANVVSAESEAVGKDIAARRVPAGSVSAGRS
jgi:hypothetical protein